MTISALTLLTNSELLFQYPVDGAKDHIEMAQQVLDCDYLCQLCKLIQNCYFSIQWMVLKTI